jgi:hypothetical protein
LNELGLTIEDLEAEENQPKLEAKVREWLKVRIAEIEMERAKQAVAA